MENLFLYSNSKMTTTSIEETAIEIFKPVMEMAIYAASRYANACNRNTVTLTDMEYGMKFAAMNHIGKQIGSYFPDLYDDDDDEDESESESYDEEEDEFCRYTGDDMNIIAIHKAHDTWDDWVPENPAEILIKRAIDEKAQAMQH